jgi:REP element-mobilizing transposase RayT
MLAAQCIKHSVRIWAYCLMNNHTHLIEMEIQFGRQLLTQKTGRKKKETGKQGA